MTTQILFAGILPPTNLMPTLPAANAAPAESVNTPPQLLAVTVSNKVMLPGAPVAVVGNMSTNVTAVMVLAVGFDSCIDNDEAVLGATVPGVNDLAIDGGAVTVKVPLPAVLTPALLLVTALAGILFT